MLAQGYHASMRFVGPVRREIGIRNIFNVLGPLTNPASASLQVTGVYSDSLVEPIARVRYSALQRLRRNGPGTTVGNDYEPRPPHSCSGYH